MIDPQVRIRDWRTPDDLEPANFSMNENVKNPSPEYKEQPSYEKKSKPENKENTSPEHKKYSQQENRNNHTPDNSKETSNTSSTNTAKDDNNLVNKLLPLIMKFNNGGLDITTILDLFDKSGQGLGALGKLLPIIAPLLSGLNIGSKKKSTEDTIDYNTINLDN